MAVTPLGSTVLSREISEDIGGEADIASLLQVLDSGAGTKAPVLLPRPDHLMGLRRAHRTGVQRAGAQYLSDGADLADQRRARRHRPEAGRGRRTAPRAIAEDRDLFTLPDLRSAPAAQLSRGR
jgi:hypothetical protein